MTKGVCEAEADVGLRRVIYQWPRLLRVLDNGKEIKRRSTRDRNGGGCCICYQWHCYDVCFEVELCAQLKVGHRRLRAERPTWRTQQKIAKPQNIK